MGSTALNVLDDTSDEGNGLDVMIPMSERDHIYPWLVLIGYHVVGGPATPLDIWNLDVNIDIVDDDAPWEVVHLTRMQVDGTVRSIYLYLTRRMPIETILMSNLSK